MGEGFIPLRILFLNSVRRDMWGGGEKWMVTAGRGLRASGHEVFLGGRPGSLFLEEGRRAGLETIELSFRGDIDPVLAMRLYRFLKKKKVTTVCTNYDKELRVSMLPAAILRGVAVVARKGLPLIRDRMAYRISYEHFVRGIIVPSESLKKELSEIRWLDPEAIHVIPNGVDANLYRPRSDRSFLSELGLEPNTLTVGIVARLSGQKGHDVFLESAGMVLKKVPEARFICVGDGSERKALEEKVRRLSLAGNVIFTGHRSDMPRVYSSLDVVVLPSLYEGLPNALLEAMASGRPVVATNAGGTEEVVVNGTTGFLVEKEDMDGIAGKVCQLLLDRELSEKMGAAGRERVLNEFTVQGMIRSVEALFQSFSQ